MGHHCKFSDSLLLEDSIMGVETFFPTIVNANNMTSESYFIIPVIVKGFPGHGNGKEPDRNCKRQETRVRSLGWEDPLE